MNATAETMSRSNTSTLYGPILIVIALTVAWRTILFNGPLGSDDLVYFGRALDIATGQWTSADYNGALRYGFNIPAGFLLWALGNGEFQINLWPLICSVLEVAAVWFYCKGRFGEKTALLAATLLALTPLHVAAATRVHTDPIASFFLTLSFILFLESESRKSRTWAFAAGLAMGMVFWTKELLGLALFSFVLWPLVVFRIERRWIHVVAGGLLMLFAHFALMQIISGDPLHLFKTVFGQISRSFIAEGTGEDSPLYYFKYLLFDIRHTALIGPLALIGILTIAARWHTLSIQTKLDLRGLLFWLLSLMAILSLFPVSLSPLRFAMKQSNYLTLFLAPLCILSAIFLAHLKPRTSWPLLALIAATAVPLAVLQQHSYRVFVSNSKAALSFAKKNPNDLIFASRNNVNIALFDSRVSGNQETSSRFNHLTTAEPENLTRPDNKGRLIVVEDRETLGWNKIDHLLQPIPPCWTLLEVLTPEGLPSSMIASRTAMEFATKLPASLSERITSQLARVSHPQPARLWQVPIENPWCVTSTSLYG
ncbi:MAG: glycosyltransferase family 39 protein [Azoarcus sp.]|nr:glycosyltransferase family 39 protein [Azoarcus sp.]